MKKFKFILPILAFVMAIAGVFALSSFDEVTPENTDGSYLTRPAWFGIQGEACQSCENPVPSDCSPTNNGEICKCSSNVIALESPNHENPVLRCDVLQKPN